MPERRDATVTTDTSSDSPINTLDYAVTGAPTQDQDDQPVRYESEQPAAQTSEQGFLGGVDITPAGPRANPSFSVQPHEAVPVYERASTDHDTRSMSVGANAVQLVGRRPGRKYVVLSCPTTFTPLGGVAAAPLGFQTSDDPTMLNVGAGYQINPGYSIEIDSEAAVWVAALPGAVTGLVQWSEAYSTPGGGDGY